MSPQEAYPYTNSSSSGTHRLLYDQRVYYEPEALMMMGQIVVYSGRQPRLLSPHTPEPSTTTQTISPQAVAEQIVREAVSLPSLEAVHVKGRVWGMECWIIVNHSTEEERFSLYDLEWQMMEQLRGVGFKFNLIDRQGRPLDMVVTLEPADASIILPKVYHA